jgi:3-oxoadipate enol-lactonase
MGGDDDRIHRKLMTRDHVFSKGVFWKEAAEKETIRHLLSEGWGRSWVKIYRKKERKNMTNKAKVGAIELAYTIKGEGDPLILIGGFSMVKERWERQVSDLSHQFRVITFDNRGVGESTVPEPDFTIADMAADVVGLMDYLRIDKSHVFGVSMGGLIAQTLSLDHGDRIRKAALGCTSHGGRFAIAPDAEVMALLAKMGDPGMPAEEAIRLRLPIMYSERFIREEPEKIEKIVAFSLRYQPTLKGAQGQMKALSFFNVKKRLGEIRCPVLVITGDEDRMMPSDNSRLIAEGIPGAEIYLVKGAGHAFFEEKPEEVNRVLAAFFKK